MKRALASAERKTPAWSDLAYSFLISFARRHYHFISEEVSTASKVDGFPQPPTDKAWGQIYRRAIKAQIIVRDGAGVSTRRHASICPRWRSRIFTQDAGVEAHGGRV